MKQDVGSSNINFGRSIESRRSQLCEARLTRVWVAFEVSLRQDVGSVNIHCGPLIESRRSQVWKVAEAWEAGCLRSWEAGGWK